jgi:hypothetical protein
VSLKVGGSSPPTHLIIFIRKNDNQLFSGPKRDILDLETPGSDLNLTRANWLL